MITFVSFVKMAFVLSSSEEGAGLGAMSAADRRLQESQLLKQAHEQIQMQVKQGLEVDKKKDQEKLKAI